MGEPRSWDQLPPVEQPVFCPFPHCVAVERGEEATVPRGVVAASGACSASALDTARVNRHFPVRNSQRGGQCCVVLAY